MLVSQVYSECPSYDELVPALLQHSIDQLPSHVHFKPGVPVKPMLAKPTTGTRMQGHVRV
jgi:DNA ligase-1